MPLPWIVAGAVTLVAVGAAAWAADESGEREKEQGRYRSVIADLERKLDNTERDYRQLRERLGEKNRQVRELASEVRRLRRNLAAARRRAAA